MIAGASIAFTIAYFVDGQYSKALFAFVFSCVYAYIAPIVGEAWAKRVTVLKEEKGDPKTYCPCCERY